MSRIELIIFTVLAGLLVIRMLWIGQKRILSKGEKGMNELVKYWLYLVIISLGMWLFFYKYF